jgi:hypothetical protein
MKMFSVLLLGSLLTFNLTALAETKPADQKWLEAVQKMVTKGEHRVSTPSEERANLLKSWGKEKGYSVHVTKTEGGYLIEISKNLASK